jgi:hypothetical protein
MRYIVVTIPVILVLGALFVALNSVRSENAESGIEGRVVLEPICPVEQDPPDPNCAPAPYETTVTITEAGSTKVIAAAKTDAQGYFVVDLPPGSYVLAPKGGTVLPSCEIVSTTVRTDAYAHIDISCDTGIR